MGSNQTIRGQVEGQDSVCSVPPVNGWFSRWFEQKHRGACVEHDIGYVVRTGDRGDRSILRYIWDEFLERRSVDKQFLRDMLLNSNNVLEKGLSYVSYGFIRLFGWSYWWKLGRIFMSEPLPELEQKPNLFQRILSPVVNTFWGNEPVKRKQGTNTLLTIAALYFMVQNGGIDVNTDQILQYIGCQFFVDCQAMGIEPAKILENVG